jgi:hypothetical protein
LKRTGVVRPAKVLINIESGEQRLEGPGYGLAQFIFRIHALCVVDDAPDMAIIERYISRILCDQNSGDPQRVADSKLIIHIRITTRYVRDYGSRSPNLIPDILDNWGSTINVVCLDGLFISADNPLSHQIIREKVIIFGLGLFSRVDAVQPPK